MHLSLSPSYGIQTGTGQSPDSCMHLCTHAKPPASSNLTSRGALLFHHHQPSLTNITSHTLCRCISTPNPSLTRRSAPLTQTGRLTIACDSPASERSLILRCLCPTQHMKRRTTACAWHMEKADDSLEDPLVGAARGPLPRTLLNVCLTSHSRQRQHTDAGS